MVRQSRGVLWGFDAHSRRLFAAGTAVAASALLANGLGDGNTPSPGPELLVDVNEAPVEVLLALPRIGPVLAGRIVGERGARPFRSLADLDARVRGVGPATAATLRPHLRFNVPGGPPTPRPELDPDRRPAAAGHDPS